MPADMNAQISEWFEPKPELSATIGSFSDKGYWKGVCYLPISKDSARYWIPLDYLHDEAANARLLEAMPEPALKVDRYTGNWMCYASPAYTMVEHQDRKTAVVLAFCRFANIPMEDR